MSFGVRSVFIAARLPVRIAVSFILSLDFFSCLLTRVNKFPDEKPSSTKEIDRVHRISAAIMRVRSKEREDWDGIRESYCRQCFSISLV